MTHPLPASYGAAADTSIDGPLSILHRHADRKRAECRSDAAPSWQVRLSTVGPEDDVLMEFFVALALVPPGDTLRIRRIAGPPRFDGAVSEQEYGAPSLMIPSTGSGVRLWAVQVADTVYLAALLADTSYSWRDALVISLDPRGDRTPAPGHDDTQWDIMRATDSSVVYQGRHGRWMPPGDDPDWRLGSARAAGGWEIASASDAIGWSVELRLPVEWFSDSTGRRAAIAFRAYDESPQVWLAWPAPHPGEHATRVEMLPERWALVLPAGE